ncbi:hypothetical protein LOTGIDRAFT_171149 [Lottia gigantea]|uniref:Uncharacterized protein n=1 Tax=Lottia gigantea TaxID=225164 RepID=V4AI23_LOTGI|nr:hypothetical protein LOTGIDRAFT_171149 [Lottia gigantea]ESP03724.1 hypothetical protein LOTGIDRAFT_171149 [Lottia gigantea]
MTILLPVISRSVDDIILDYLSKIQHGDLTSTLDGDWNQNNKNPIDENNNNQVDDLGELVDDDVDIQDWAQVEGPKVEESKDVAEDLVWAEDPWTQTPLTNSPDWMKLPGIDFDTQEEETLETNNEKFSEVLENDEDFLAPCVEIKDWSKEPFEQLPLDVPRWALLPGVDYPVRNGNSLYWEMNLKKHMRVRRKFGKKVYSRNLPTLLEEKLVYNNDAKPMLFVPTRYGRIFYTFQDY